MPSDDDIAKCAIFNMLILPQNCQKCKLCFFHGYALSFCRYCSLVTFREVFFVNKVHRKPENCSAKSCECMISVHREACY